VQKKQGAIAWEARWAVPVAATTFLAVVLMVASGLVRSVSGEGDAEILRSVHEHGGSVIFSGLLQAAGFALLAVPLVYLFRVVRARSDRVLPQLIGLVIIAPLFLGISAGLAGGARNEAADQFVAGEAESTLSAKEAKEKCVADRQDEGGKAFAEEFEPAQGETALAACEDREIEDDEASNAIGEASLASFVSGLGIAGGLGFVVALFYSCLWAMRTGILTRFWGSLGMALGIAALLGLILFTLIWFIYFGLLVIGRVPGGRPPAWAAGEAIPWPTPGEKAAAELEASDPPEEPEPPALSNGNGDSPGDGGGGERRKRKQRD
jgi:hypothetical protein